jgi:hypothetical protein
MLKVIPALYYAGRVDRPMACEFRACSRNHSRSFGTPCTRLINRNGWRSGLVTGPMPISNGLESLTSSLMYWYTVRLSSRLIPHLSAESLLTYQEPGR